MRFLLIFMKHTFVIVLILCLVSACTATATGVPSSTVDSPPPATYSALGLDFGSSIAENMNKPVDGKKVKFKEPFQSYGFSCERNFISTIYLKEHLTSENKMLLDDYSFQRNFEGNSVGIDLSLNDRVTGGWYKVNVLNQEIDACFVYFDDKLSSITVKNYYEVIDEVEAILNEKYGKASVITGSMLSLSSWKVENQLVISSTGSKLEYEYLPIKAQYLNEAIPVYKNAEKSLVEKNKKSF